MTDQANRRAAVFGASGGIGAAVTAALAGDPSFSTVYALARREVEPGGDRVRALRFDLRDEQTIETAACTMAADGPLDFVFVATGILHDGKSISPEKSMSEMTASTMADVFAINTIGPALIASHLLPRLQKDRRTVFAALSARVGSIEDNRLGGWVSYRASKAALNMVLRTLAIEHARRNPKSVIAALHPGTVATPLSDPFSSRVPKGKLFDAPTAARQLLDVIDDLGTGDSGGFFAWDGSRIPF